MKLKKVRITGILLVALLFALSSCSLIFNENVDTDLGDLAAFSRGLDTAVRFLAIDSDFSAGSRTVNQDNDGDDNDDNPIKSTPKATYIANGGSDSKLIQIPAGNAVIENFYGTNPAITAKFSMKPEGSGYRIKLYIYDSADFMLDYVYEEYFVKGGDSDNWTYLEEDWSTTGFIDYYDNMHDGSKVQHTNYLFGPAVSGGNVYTITTNTIIDNLDDYKFTLKDDGKTPNLFEAITTELPVINIDVAGDFYSYKESSGNYKADEAPKRAPRHSAPNRPNFESITYYSELDDQTERNLAVFSLQSVDKKKDDYARTVTRSQELYNDSTTPMTLTSKNVYSLTTYTDKNGKEKQHITKEIEQSINGSGLKVISHSEGMYKDKSPVDVSPDTLTTMNLLQDEAPGNDFTGDMSVAKKEKNGSIKTKRYTVTYNGTKFKTKEIKSRAVGSEEIELDLSLLENGQEFTLTLSGGAVFQGTYFYGRLTGTIRYPVGDIKRVDIVNGIVYLNDELWEPTEL
jgi:hypothetical protein